MKQKQMSAKPRGIKEFIRKFFVSLKRSPQTIALVALAAAFLVYSLNLTSIANTTARINSPNMGQCEFAAMLFSILAFVCFLRAFPKRQKPKIMMLVLLYAMLAGICGRRLPSENNSGYDARSKSRCYRRLHRFHTFGSEYGDRAHCMRCGMRRTRTSVTALRKAS